MRFHIYTLKARASEKGRRLTWDQLAEATGIRKSMLFRIARNQARMVRPEYIDALCTFFGVAVDELLTAESIDLPLNLDIRPDRKGKLIRPRAKTAARNNIDKEDQQ